MKNKPFEDELRERFADYESSADFEQLWGQLDDRRRRRVIPFWWWLGSASAILLVVLAIGWWQRPAAICVDLGAFPIPATTVSLNTSDTVIKGNSIIIKNQMNVPTSTEAEEVDLARTNDVKNLQSSTELTTINIINGTIDSTASNKSTMRSRFAVENRGIERANTTVVTPPTKSLPNELPTEIKTPKNKIISPLLTQSIKPFFYPKMHFKSSVQPFYNPSYVRWWLDVRIFYGKNFRELQTDNLALLERRLATEQPLDAISGSVQLRYYFNQKLYMQTGVRYQQHTTKLTENTNRTFTEMRDNALVEIIQYTDGSREEVRGQAEVEITETVERTLYNQYRSWSIPLTVGTEIKLAKKWYWNAGVGLNYHFSQRQDGQIYLNATDFLPAEMNSVDYHTTHQFSMLGQLETRFLLANKLMFIIGIEGQLPLQNLRRTGEIIEKYSLLQGTVGVQIPLR